MTESEEIGETTPMRPVANPAKNALRPAKPISPANTPGKKYPLQESEGAIQV